ncbi:protealysin inhibitor emfourin [Microbacterium proteolyticum]|uniref:protealysin inhibitor emfourin n=1 Tax=Microbacterium proteolyticum TaxID=1572644 RepID=UPI0035C1A4A6
MPRPEATPGSTFAVVVVRSGGIAGMSRRWRAEPDPEGASRWRSLIDRCPWDAPPPPSSGADRFQWRIDVEEGGTAVHHARLADTQVEGPWRALIDEVRRAAGAHRT